MEDPELRLCFFKVYMVYSLVHCQENPVAPESLELCISLYNSRIKQVYLIVTVYQQITLLQISSKAKIEDAFAECLSAMVDQKCSKSFISSVVDMLLSFMFHIITLPAGLSSYLWFFKSISPSSTEPLLQYITPAQYKFYLLLILKLNNQVNEDHSDVLKLFKSDVSS